CFMGSESPWCVAVERTNILLLSQKKLRFWSAVLVRYFNKELFWMSVLFFEWMYIMKVYHYFSHMFNAFCSC
ncbi:hypothetical protein, partial [Bartonella sp. AA2SXKL]|uniref:hypothetical protein n=1 Tax=Bartonella sp. AA2SXKL TaxID=3243432 RepID=UPI0035D0BF3D